MTPAHLDDRVRDLEMQLSKGETRLARLDAEREALVRQMLRIEGAITLAREIAAPAPEQESPKHELAGIGLAETG